MSLRVWLSTIPLDAGRQASGQRGGLGVGAQFPALAHPLQSVRACLDVSYRHAIALIMCSRHPERRPAVPVGRASIHPGRPVIVSLGRGRGNRVADDALPDQAVGLDRVADYRVGPDGEALSGGEEGFSLAGGKCRADHGLPCGPCGQFLGR
jgi:hypothetical protein